jgi:integrase
MPLKKLTDTFVAAIKPPAKPKQIEYRDALVRGFGLRVSYNGTRTWAVALRVPVAGALKQTRITLGRYPAVSLADARAKAGEVLAMAQSGKDPRQHGQEQRRAALEASRNTFTTIREQFIEYCRGRHLRSATLDQYERTLTSPRFAEWEHRPIADITRRDVLDLLRPLGQRTMANRHLAILRALFNWAASQDIITATPTGHVKPPAVEAARDRHLNDAEVAVIWPAFDAAELFAPVLRLMLLLGQRKGETGGMRRSELEDLDGANPTWNLPPERTKNKRAHKVPLSPLAVTIIKQAIETAPESEAGLIFSTTGRTPLSGWSKAKREIDAAIKANEHKLAGWRIHDLRRTTATGLAELGASRDVVELILNHVSGTRAGVAGVYNRSNLLPERRRALERWAAHVERVTGQAAMLRAVA